ncbi:MULTISPECIES: ABC transporter substrate-binding protein [Streptomyces]|uniref:Sugar ABC transporter substrate-binding protein n=1 Tax=Streptomyces lycii TaxID=2654337 RepID=A0ABQ7FRB9_9ACTN|nr:MULTISPECIES: sugar ABC transporter substrate-binding protein [Streptomyces]KAF4410269.1 sugar ABC transporter substrate-binding protein [Streptomyces lycii]PGH46958.1 ABC transporter substrate-binding protein [Streptomyces sp. Ru87]
MIGKSRTGKRPRTFLRAGAAGAALAALVALSGCSGTGTGSDDGRTTIRFAWWGDDRRAATTRSVLADFEKANPDITVETETSDFNAYFDKLATETAANDAPDVMTLGGAYPREYSDRGALLDLAEVSQQLDLSKFPEATLDSAKFDGTLYGVPTGGNAISMIVNPAVFEAAGVELPDTGSWTWEEFVSLAGEISEKSPKGTVGYEPRVNDTLGVYAAQRGTPIFDEKGELGVSAATVEDYFALEKSLLANKGMPSAEVVQEVSTVTPEQTLMGRGRAAMTITYSNLLGAYTQASGEELKLVHIPGEHQYERPGTTVLPSQYYAISARSQHPEAAAELLSHLVNSAEAGKKIRDDRGLPFNTEVREAITPALDEAGRANAEYVDQVAENGAAAVPIPPAGGSGLNDTTSKLDSDVLFGRASPADAAKAWVAEMKQALDSV